MASRIHISTARAMLNSGDPVDLTWLASDGSVLSHKVVSLRYDFRGGWRNVKILPSGVCRRVRDVCMMSVSGLEVFL